ncbi:hypothetical protein D3C79_697440 [compost metagenome]
MPTIRHAFRQRIAALGKHIPRPGQWRPTEGQGQAIAVADHFDGIGIEHGGDVADRFGQGRNACFRMRREVGRHLINDDRWNQRLVALDIDDNGVRSQPELGGHFGQTVSARIMIFTGHQHFSAKGLADLVDTGIISGNHHATGAALACLLPDMLDHRLAGNRQQRLARQAGGSQACRNHHSESQAHLSRRSSSVRVRASLSSITGIPSRIG